MTSPPPHPLEPLLARLADALDRLAPPPGPPEPDPASGLHWRWDGARLAAVPAPHLQPLAVFAGVEGQVEAIRRNLAALSAGGAAHDMLLWGARGMGKSALVRTLADATGVALVESGADTLATLPRLFDRLGSLPRPFLLFVDDLAFTGTDPAVRQLRSLLDGGVSARPANLRLAVTSNHRHLVERPAPDSRHARDSADDQLALVDRFGLVLGFHVPDQATYLEMVARHCAAEGLAFDPEEAIAFALARGGRSGRTAWHFRTELLTRRHSA
ncbi:MAG: DUF815 domain-containing protein [Sphingomonadaceae bacterium]